jgi:hypothetical protein
MDKNRGQHQSFHNGLERFKTYSTETKPEDYDPKKLTEILDSFVKPFQLYSKEEVDTLVGLKFLNSTPLVRMWKEAEGKAGGGARKVHSDDNLSSPSLASQLSALAQVPLTPCFLQDKAFPLILGYNDRAFEGGIRNFPPVPCPVTVDIKYCWGRTHAGAWRFCLSDIFGHPRPLMFLPRIDERIRKE